VAAKEHETPLQQEGGRPKWARPTLTPVGNVTDVLQTGEGKITFMAADPGEPKKTKPSG